MRHRKAGSKLNRSVDHRKALRRNLVTALLQHGRIETTEAKARAVRGQAEKLITLAKRGLAAEAEDPSRGVHARRLAAGRLNRWGQMPDGDAGGSSEDKLFRGDRAPLRRTGPAATRASYKLGPRRGDAAPMVLLELVED
jgi:large subunit ribosomal protein L17